MRKNSSKVTRAQRIGPAAGSSKNVNASNNGHENGHESRGAGMGQSLCFTNMGQQRLHGVSTALPRQGHAAGNPRPACPGVWAPASGLQAGGQQHLREGGNVLSPQWLVGTEACQHGSLAVRCLVDVSRQSLEGTDHHRRRIGRESDVSGAGGAGVARVKHGDFPLKSVRRSALPAVIREQPKYPWLLATTQPISNIRAGNYPAALGPG